MMTSPWGRAGTPILLLAASASPLVAQQEPDRPIDPSVFADQEPVREDRPDAPQSNAFPGWMGDAPGRGGSGFTSRFDPRFNPSLGIVLDGFMTFSVDAADDRAGAYDRAELRAIEFNYASRIDPLGWAYAVAEFGNEGEGEYAFELLEAAVWFDQLPNNFNVRAGRFFSDFGKWNTVHIHDRPYPFEEGVRSEYFGGSLIMNGLEVHSWFAAGDTPVRWSIGIAPGFEGHGHPVLPTEDGHGEEEEEGHHHHGFASESEGERGLDNFAFTGRLSAQHDVGTNGFFQWGVSAFLTDAGLLEEHEDDEVFELGQNTFAIDLMYRNVDASAGTSNTAGLEIFLNDRDIFDEATETIGSGEGVGLTGFYEYGINPQWSVGAQASWWEHADKEDGGDWFTGEDAGSQVALFTTWNLSEFNRLRLAVAKWDPMPGEESDLVVALQWIGIMGSHFHPLDW